MAVFAVVDETGFERGLDAGHDRLVDVALALFAAFDLGLEVHQLLAVDDRQAALFGLRRVDQHAFHVHSFARRRRAGARIAHSRRRRCRGRRIDARETRRNRKESPWTAASGAVRRPAARQRWRVRGSARRHVGPARPAARGAAGAAGAQRAQRRARGRGSTSRIAGRGQSMARLRVAGAGSPVFGLETLLRWVRSCLLCRLGPSRPPRHLGTAARRGRRGVASPWSAGPCALGRRVSPASRRCDAKL